MYFNAEGFAVGLGLFLFGLLLDNTISYNSKQILLQRDKRLLMKAYGYTAFNLLILNPVFYDVIYYHLITNHEEGFHFIKYVVLLMFQAVGYYLLHMAMHNNRQLRRIHKFHHRFTDVLIPSLGVSVTVAEYSFAYATPFLIGSYFTNTNLTTLSMAILTISFLNILIHCSELYWLDYYCIFVSPSDHAYHHKNKPDRNTYAAPFINIDNIVDHIGR